LARGYREILNNYLKSTIDNQWSHIIRLGTRRRRLLKCLVSRRMTPLFLQCRKPGLLRPRLLIVSQGSKHKRPESYLPALNTAKSLEITPYVINHYTCWHNCFPICTCFIDGSIRSIHITIPECITSTRFSSDTVDHWCHNNSIAAI